MRQAFRTTRQRTLRDRETGERKTTTKPVSKAYVKVYAQMADGQVKSYEDGYTDLRGRFDYASLNTNDLDVAQKFSVARDERRPRSLSPRSGSDEEMTLVAARSTYCQLVRTQVFSSKSKAQKLAACATGRSIRRTVRSALWSRPRTG